jgi:hypothetical protein
MEMQVIRGTVANIRHSTEVSGNDKSVSTSQVAVFDLGGQAVEIKLMESIVLSNGDEVIVAGSTKRGLFRGLGYRNVTRRVDGKGPIAIYLIVGVVFCAVIVFLPVGLWLLNKARNYDQAFKAVTAAPQA